MSIRKATSEDAPVIKALIDAHVPSGTLLARTLDFILAHIDDYLVAERDGQLAGAVHLEEYAPSLAEIRSLSVHERWQGHRVGPELVAAAERLARARQYTTLFAVSDRDRFFIACGYEPRHVPELDRERSEVSRFKGVFAKDLAPVAF
ncbi:MAG TPA: GNAT family N-acetyltransferase, partial [Gemmatimonadaceae bacterium]|nr:GNAT family N-acetyltransferase [Gemmatimonadaceae bacterium]